MGAADPSANTDRALIAAVRQGLDDRRDPVRAKAQQAYMKSAMPYAGVVVPELRRMTRTLAKNHPLPTYDVWHDTLQTLWREAAVREERYVVTEIAGLTPSLAFAIDQTSFSLYEEFIVDGAWWDHVDDVASRFVGPLVRQYPAPMKKTMRRWSTDADRWRRRTSIICQLGAGPTLDTALLADCIVANIAEVDFFLRKAIGWALRQHARVDPGWVRAFVDAHPDLSPLSRREATKHL